MIALYWLVIFVVFLVIEIITMGLTTIWFAGGALIAAAISALGLGLPVQITVFLLSSILLLCLTRPIAMKHFNKKIEKTNAESLIGVDTIVLEEIDALHGTGKVVVNGIEWSAMADEREDLYVAGSVVTVVGIQGVKLIVTKK